MNIKNPPPAITAFVDCASMGFADCFAGEAGSGKVFCLVSGLLERVGLDDHKAILYDTSVDADGDDGLNGLL